MSAHQNEISRARGSESLQKECDRIFHDHYQEVDRAHLEQLCQRYRDLVPPERIQRVENLPTTFEDRERFERSCRKDKVQLVQGGDRVVGYSQGDSRPAHVDLDNPQWEKTVVHERLHQLADPSAEQQLGKGPTEGITEDLAIKEMGAKWDPKLPRSYSRERALAHNVRELCGDQPVDRAYFQGDVSELRICLDRRLGEGNLDKLKNIADASDSPERTEERND